jgi:hypothetical protein
MARRGALLAATIPQTPAATLRQATMANPAPAPNSSGTVQPTTMATPTAAGSTPRAAAASATASSVSRCPNAVSPSSSDASSSEAKTRSSFANAAWAMTSPSDGAATAYPVRPSA